jgi:hypothetical protein
MKREGGFPMADDDRLNNPRTSALPENASEPQHAPSSAEDDADWGVGPEPDDDNDEPQASADDAVTNEPEKDWDPWRGWQGRPRRSASEQDCVDKTHAPNEGEAAGLDLRNASRVDDHHPAVVEGLGAQDGNEDDNRPKTTTEPKASKKPANPRPRKNAIKHGAFARDVLLPGESRAEFERLLQALIDEWKPDAETLIEAVRMLAAAIWVRRRAERFGREELELAQELPEEREATVIEEVSRMLSTATSEKVVKWRLGLLRENYRTFIEQNYPRANYQDFQSWLMALQDNALRTIVSVHNSELLREWRNVRTQTARAERVRAKCEQHLTLSERADSRVQKAIKTLIQLKGWKTAA